MCRAAAGIPSRTLGHAGPHPLASFNFWFVIRCDRDNSSMVFPPNAPSHVGMSRGGFAAPAAFAATSANSRRVTG